MKLINSATNLKFIFLQNTESVTYHVNEVYEVQRFAANRSMGINKDQGQALKHF